MFVFPASFFGNFCRNCFANFFLFHVVPSLTPIHWILGAFLNCIPFLFNCCLYFSYVQFPYYHATTAHHSFLFCLHLLHFLSKGCLNLFAFVCILFAFFVQRLFHFFIFYLHLFVFFCIFCPTAVSIFPAQFPYYRATTAHQYHSWVVKQRHPGSSLLFNKCICEFTFRLD